MPDNTLQDAKQLKGMPDGERWVWLAGRLVDMEGSLARGSKKMATTEQAIQCINTRCARRKWISGAMYVLILTLIGLAVWAIKAQVGG